MYNTYIYIYIRHSHFTSPEKSLKHSQTFRGTSTVNGSPVGSCRWESSRTRRRHLWRFPAALPPEAASGSPCTGPSRPATGRPGDLEVSHGDTPKSSIDRWDFPWTIERERGTSMTKETSICVSKIQA